MHKTGVMHRTEGAEYLTTAEAAKLLQVHRSTLTRRARAGRIDALHKGSAHTGGYVFERESIERLAERSGVAGRRSGLDGHGPAGHGRARLGEAPQEISQHGIMPPAGGNEGPADSSTGATTP